MFLPVWRVLIWTFFRIRTVCISGSLASVKRPLLCSFRVRTAVTVAIHSVEQSNKVHVYLHLLLLSRFLYSACPSLNTAELPLIIREVREMFTNWLKTLECGVIWYVTRRLRREHKMCRVMSRVFRLRRKVIWIICLAESSQEFRLTSFTRNDGPTACSGLVWGCAWQLKLHTSRTRCSWSLKPSPDSL